jgi:hypothetical protein
MKKTKQGSLAGLFGKSQQWVSKMQNRPNDPMPRDQAGAREWGIRQGLLPADGSLQFETPAPSPVVQADMELKSARTEKLLIEIALKRGDLLRKEDVERQRAVSAASFRRAACDYPARARPILERFVTDATTIESIMRGLEPIAGELLNCADPRQMLKTQSKEEVRAALLARVDEIMQCVE